MNHCLTVFILVCLLKTVGWSFAQADEPAASVLADEKDRIAVLERISPTVVCVMDGGGGGGGSGVLVSSDGFAVSNYHVTASMGPFMKCGLNDGRVYDAVLVGMDPVGDVSLIQLLGRDDFPLAEVGDSDAVRVGDEVLALGNPFLLASDFTPTVTFGICSGIHRYQYPAGTFLEYTDCLQIDASINPGNSGGPLFDRQGRWIGINGRASFEKRGRVNTGAAYAISGRQVGLFLEHLRSGRMTDHGSPELTVMTSSSGAVQVDQVAALSEAERRGLRPGDEVLQFAGRTIASANDFQNVLGIYPAGVRLPLTVRTNDGDRTMSLRLRPRHNFEDAPELPMERQPPGPGSEQKQPVIPEQWKGLFEQRAGFANYYFNRLMADRILKGVRQSAADGEESVRVWKVGTEDNPSLSGEIVLADRGVGLSLGKTTWFQPSGESSASEESPAYPGLLRALQELHGLLTRADSGFDGITAIGREEHWPSAENVDVVEASAGAVRTRFSFAVGEPFPMAVDVIFAEGQDEARILLEGGPDSKGTYQPRRIGCVLPDDDSVRWLRVDSTEIKSGGAAE